jgi:hypothetical protein
MRELLPLFADAARRLIRVELLWGLKIDPEDSSTQTRLTDVERVLDQLSGDERKKIQISQVSSGSHSKIIIYDHKTTGKWISVVGSCNYLSSNFDWIEISVRSRSQKLASKLLGQLIVAQLPASGSWSPTARRLNRAWSSLQEARSAEETGKHELTMLVDGDHYACVTRARDLAQQEIVIACDLFGVAAETSVIVPMKTAAKNRKNISLVYSRPSRFLLEAGRRPDADSSEEKGISFRSLPNFHAKILYWDRSALAVTSFNWMSTIVDGGRSRGAEIGIMIEGPEVCQILVDKLAIVAPTTFG